MSEVHHHVNKASVCRGSWGVCAVLQELEHGQRGCKVFVVPCRASVCVLVALVADLCWLLVELPLCWCWKVSWGSGLSAQSLSLSSVTVSHSGSLRMVLGLLYGICPKTGALGILGWRHRVALWETTKHSQCWARLISKTRLEHLPYGDSPVASHCVFQCPYYPALLLQWNTSTSHCSDNGKFMMLLQWVIA